jgi:ribose transport system ATP-binding protein
MDSVADNNLSPEGGEILRVEQLTREFPGILAIDHLNLFLQRGEIRALMGENGAGKSTLCNIITGLYGPTSGNIYFKGQKVDFHHPKDALQAGIRMVYQERNLIEYLTGAQSICLGLEERKYGVFVDEKKMYAVAQAIREKAGAAVPLNIPISQLSAAQQQMIEILRAVAHTPELLILDEPMAALGNEEIRILFEVMGRLKEKGVAILLISHKLEEVFKIADTISILRNGKHIITIKNGEVDRMQVVRYMLGQDVTTMYPVVENYRQDNILLELDNFGDSTGKLHNISMNIRKGEVVGIYGLLGSGRTELLECIYGLRPCKGKRIVDNEVVVPKTTPDKMIQRGVFLIPEDRRHCSLFRDFYSLKENVSIGYIEKITNRLGLVNTKKEKEIFKTVADYPGLRCKYVNMFQKIDDLSGGNQQKLVLGRWIFRDNLKLLLLDEPTQGIDVGVKHDIYVLIRALAKKGAGILIVSSDLPEITGICDRLYIIKDGTLCAQRQRDIFENEEILEMVL